MACDSISDVVKGTGGKAVIEDELVLRMTRWQITPGGSETTWGDSDSAGFTNRKGARKDCTGAIDGKFSTDRIFYDMVQEHDEVKVALWLDSTRYWVFPCALVQNYSLEVNPDTNEVIGWSMAFGSIGRYYRPGESGAPTQTLPSS
jgi:hypothetical protein